MTTVLVTGGAGFVGSQTVLHLRALGWRVLVFDDFSTGHRDFAAHADRCFEGDVLDGEVLAEALTAEPLDGIIHCAALALVEDSVRQPERYLRHNVVGGLNLIEAALAAGRPPIVFSSSATVYGAPEVVPTPEEARTAPINPYGFSKLATEHALFAADRAHGLKSVSLRYFNAAGADPKGRVGERHDPETHVIPNLIRAALGADGPFRVKGTDYPTRDGTCVRDFVHTEDIARAHRLALEHLWTGHASGVFNIGTARGISIRELVDAVEAEIGTQVPVEHAPRRPGDAPTLVADPSRAAAVLGWERRRSDAATIVRDAMRWHRSGLSTP